MPNERLIETALEVAGRVDEELARPLYYCAERLMAGTWDENSSAASTITTLKIHLRQTRRLTDAERLLIDGDTTKED